MMERENQLLRKLASDLYICLVVLALTPPYIKNLYIIEPEGRKGQCEKWSRKSSREGDSRHRYYEEGKEEKAGKDLIREGDGRVRQKERKGRTCLKKPQQNNR